MECSEKPQKLHCLCVTSLILGALKFCNQWTRWHRWEAHRGKGCVFLFFVCFQGFLFPLPRGPLCVSQSPVPVHVSCLHHSYLCVYFAEYEMNPLKLKPCLLLSWSPCGTLCGLLIKYLLMTWRNLWGVFTWQRNQKKGENFLFVSEIPVLLMTTEKASPSLLADSTDWCCPCSLPRQMSLCQTCNEVFCTENKKHWFQGKTFAFPLDWNIQSFRDWKIF